MVGGVGPMGNCTTGVLVLLQWAEALSVLRPATSQDFIRGYKHAGSCHLVDNQCMGRPKSHFTFVCCPPYC
jgi:hypothetical protein